MVCYFLGMHSQRTETSLGLHQLSFRLSELSDLKFAGSRLLPYLCQEGILFLIIG
jgi:hypothetical protein